MSIRKKGTGSVYQRKSDGRWSVSIELKDRANKRKRYTVYARDETEAHVKLAALRATVAAGRDPTPSKQTVGAFLSDWLETVVRPSGVLAATVERYASIVRVRLVPLLGTIPLTKLSAPDVQRAYAKLAEAGYKPGTLGITHGVLVQALDQAVRWGLIPTNPARHTRRRRAEPAERTALTPEEQTKVLRALDGHPDEACWRLALTTGLRIGELLGLRWRDVDLDRGTLQVAQQSQYAGQATHEQRRPKTRAGRRSRRLDAATLAALRRHRQRQNELRLRAGSAWQDRDLVFPRANGLPQYAARVSDRLATVGRRAGVTGLHPHRFRHTWASVALGLGVPIPEVAQGLGHANAGVTLSVYSHFIPGQESPAADLVQAYWERLGAADVQVEEK